MSTMLYRRFLFTDEERTNVSAVAYNAVIKEFAKLLLPYKRYYLSGAKVRPEIPLYQVGDSRYNWLIVTRTHTEVYQESLPPQLLCKIDIHTFANIHKYADTENRRSEFIVQIHTTYHATLVYNFQVNNMHNSIPNFRFFFPHHLLSGQDSREKPMLLTLWNQFEEDKGAHLANTVSAGNTDSSHCLKRTTDVITIKDALASIRYVKTCWISGKIKFVNDNRPLWTATCHVCLKNYNMPPNTPMKCRSCREDSHVEEARCRLPVAIQNKIGTIYAIIYGADAEQLIPYNNNELFEAEQQSESTYHTILKLYIAEMMVVQGDMTEMKSSTKEHQHQHHQSNLFSRTLKNVMESVAIKDEKAPHAPTPESSTKKRINFDNQQITTQATSATTPQSSSHSTLQGTVNPTATPASPSKKSRPKMD
ncbi:replication protein A 70 kDa DNA-binding subunit B [Striga asiatica]|uniref:Replication protein A 70 kDa DNA-binding subunit B n=1 Tax=Striga asiatica TaxID=4170 RepID=A0A5A7Q2S1_STRAF|nr:replication protein A 70 kDa DNA-binding subunit B [Striga asiatica]